MLSKQEIFDRVINHLRTQGQRSGSILYDEFQCMYCGPNNLKCAVGILINPEKYNSYWDRSGGSSIKVLFEAEALPDIELTEENLELLVHLQTVHDYPSSWSTNPNRFNESGEYFAELCAKKFNLVYSPPVKE